VIAALPLVALSDHRRPVLDNERVKLELKRPDHLEDEAWKSIEVHVSRFEMARLSDDAGWAIGSAKDLVECVARVVLDAKGVVVPANADFDESVNAAHLALERQPGRDVSMSSDIRAIASSAKKIVIHVRAIRNEHGSGHGRARLKAVDEEMRTVVCDAAVLWVRWALRRLEHILVGEADRLIGELRDAIVYRKSLAVHLEAVMLPEQAPETQRAIGVAFGARTAQDTGNPRVVGIDPAIESGDLVAWPVQYRVGVVEGLLLGRWGYRTSSDRYIPLAAAVIAVVPGPELVQALPGLIEKVRSAGYPAGYLPDPEDRRKVSEALSEQVPSLPQPVQAQWAELALIFEEPDSSEQISEAEQD
jgi:Abortive infection C-terminus